MKAFVTSIGEPTTNLCLWALQRNGFDTVLIQDKSPLWQKLGIIYNQAEGHFLRVDADVIVNRDCTPENIVADNGIWWVQYQTFGMYSLDIIWGGVQYIKKDALPALRKAIENPERPERPETEMFRLPEFHNPRRCISQEKLMGIHGFGQKDIKRVKRTKEQRGQSDQYDWELAERMQQFYV